MQRADGEGISVGEYLVTRSTGYATCFSTSGIEKNRHVGVFLSNCIEYTYLYTALGLLGVPMIPLNPFLKGDSLEYVINHCDVQYLVTNRELFSERIVPIASSSRKVSHLLYVGEKIDDRPVRECIGV